MSKKKHLSVLLFSLIFVLLFTFASSAEDADAASACKISYGTIADGKFENTYSSWDTDATVGKAIKTPVVPDKNGRRAYWKATVNKKIYEIKNGDKYTVAGKTNFSLVWKDLHYVWFYNQAGTKEYVPQRLSLVMKDKFNLYNAKDTVSHSFLGWSKYKNVTSPMYTIDKTYIMVGDIRLYAVYKQKQKGTIRFFTQSAGSEYKDKKITKYMGEKFYLPTLPDNSKYKFLGWSRTKSQLTPNYTTEKQYTMVKNLTLYAVFIKKADPSVYLRYSNGDLYKVVVPDGKSVKFPSVAFSDTRTCQGWSTSKNQKCNPKYKESDVIPKKEATYYMVEDSFKDSNPNITVHESSKYDYTYYLGDSRIFLTDHFIGQYLRKKTRLIYASGKGYNWLVDAHDGFNRMLTQIQYDTVQEGAKKKAVIFCLGVNDLGNADKYISFYKSKASVLKSYGCDLYVMSVNPINISQISYCYKTFKNNPNYKESRSQALLTAFNNKLKNNLSGIYKYIDTYSYLMKTGWPTYNLYYNIPDGLHYRPDVYSKIINYTTSILDK